MNRSSRSIVSPTFATGEAEPPGSEAFKATMSHIKERNPSMTTAQAAINREKQGTGIDGDTWRPTAHAQERGAPKRRRSRGDPRGSRLAELNFGTWKDYNDLKGIYAGKTREEADALRRRMKREFVAEASAVEQAVDDGTFVEPRGPGVLRRIGTSLGRARCKRLYASRTPPRRPHEALASLVTSRPTARVF